MFSPALGLARHWPCPLAGQHKYQDTQNPHSQLCREPAPPTSTLTPALGLLGLAAKPQDPALPTSGPALALALAPGFTHQ